MKRLLPPALLVAAALSAPAAFASTWTGLTSGSWSDGTNWLDDLAPSSGDAVTFDGNSTGNLAQTLDGDFVIAGITVGSPTGAITVAKGSGGSLTLGSGGIDMSAATQNLTFSGTVAIGAAQDWNIAAGRTLSFNLGSNTAFNLARVTQRGSGTLALSGANISGGVFEIAGGTTTLAGFSSLNTAVAAGATVKVDSGATFNVVRSSGNFTLSGTVELAGGTFSLGAGTSNPATLNGTLHVSSSGTFINAQNSSSGVTQTLRSNITGSSATLNIQNASTISGALITLTGDNSGFTGTIRVNAAAGQKLVRLDASSASTSSINWAVGASGATGNILRLNASDLALGDVTLIASTLDLTAAATGATVKALTISTAANSTISVAGGLSANSLSVNWTTTISGAGTINAAGLTYFGSGGTYGSGGTKLNANGLNIRNGATLTQSAGTINVSGAFTLGLTGTSQAGTYTLNGGRLNLASGFTADGTGTGARTVNLGAGTLGASSDWSTAQAMNLTSAGTGVTVNTLDSVDGVTGRTVTLTGVLSGTGALTKAGAGTLVLAGENNYAGGVTVSGGVLATNSGSALGSGRVVLAGGTLQVGAGSDRLTLGDAANLTTTAATASVLKFNANLGSGAPANLTLAAGGKYDFSAGTLTLDLGNLFDAAGTYHLIGGGTGNVDAASYAFTGANTANFSFAFANGDLAVTAVPEPGAYGLIGAGAFAAVAFVRRRTGRSHARPAR